MSREFSGCQNLQEVYKTLNQKIAQSGQTALWCADSRINRDTEVCRGHGEGRCWHGLVARTCTEKTRAAALTAGTGPTHLIFSIWDTPLIFTRKSIGEREMKYAELKHKLAYVTQNWPDCKATHLLKCKKVEIPGSRPIVNQLPLGGQTSRCLVMHSVRN